MVRPEFRRGETMMATIGTFTKSGEDLGYVNSKCPLCRATVIELGHT